MIPKIPNQRIQASNESKPFNDLVDYIEEDKGHKRTKPINNTFESIIDYSVAETDLNTNEEKCVAIRVVNLPSIETASMQMNFTAAKNTRVKDPAYHFILSWPEHEKPSYESMFDAAQHAIKSLGLAEHQAVIAIHGNTDNWHAHIAVNRVHPITYKSKNIEWAQKTLHMAARESEIKHGWTHDNGIYIVETNERGEKHIIVNPDFAENIVNANQQYQKEAALPTWHDPESLESWLKTEVSKSLKKQLPKMQDWPALHKWLNRLNIELYDAGSGLRLEITSDATGEKFSLPASKGLRLLKRNELINRWGKFTLGALEPLYDVETFPADPIPLDDSEEAAIQPSITPDLSKFTPQQLNKGINHVHGSDGSNTGNGTLHINNNLTHFELDQSRSPPQRRSGLYELSFSSMDGDRQISKGLLSDTLRGSMGDGQSWQDPDMRRSIPGSSSGRSLRSLNRDNSKREERKEARALARQDLRNRYAQYQRFVREGDQSHWSRIKEIKSGYNQSLKLIKQKTWLETKAVKNNRSLSLVEKTQKTIAINMMAVRERLQAEANYQTQLASVRAIRVPPLSWRIWLHEQANLADQAALSALRGIVYQAQRDAKKNGTDENERADDGSKEYQEYQYKQLMARLLEQERKEVAIRAARADAMRPYEADALLRQYIGIKWHVTGNGNIEYNGLHGNHLFTDRGNRVTFDKVIVTDEEIKLALIHAEQKFGKKITLTGDDPIFSARMARLADDLGLTVLNPELQSIIVQHRDDKLNTLVEMIEIKKVDIPQEPTQEPLETIMAPAIPNNMPEEAERVESPETNELELEPQSFINLLQKKVLSIDPTAIFEIPSSNSNRTYSGRVAVTLEPEDEVIGFAQHIGRSKYALHAINTSITDAVIDVRYKNGKPNVTAPKTQETERQRKR